MTDTKRSKKRSASAGTASDGFTEEERAAIKERARELKAAGRGGRKKADDEQAVLDKIAEMPDVDRVLAERVHAVIAATAPELAPKTWYGMPAYAKDGKIVCFFQGSQKFSSRYSTLGFNDPARLDDGAMWPTAFALVEWTPAVEEKVIELVTTPWADGGRASAVRHPGPADHEDLVPDDAGRARAFSASGRRTPRSRHPSVPRFLISVRTCNQRASAQPVRPTHLHVN